MTKETTLRLDDNGRDTEDVLCISKKATKKVIAACLGKDAMRSDWKLFRLQNGDLIFGFYPQEDLYEELVNVIEVGI